jgi:hypothetical protein
MRLSESRIRRIIREEARRVLREGGDDGQKHRDRIASFETGYEFGQDDADREEENTPEAVIDRFMEDSPRMWMRVSNDFHEMADGGDMDGFRESQYPGWSDEDFRRVARILDKHFGL